MTHHQEIVVVQFRDLICSEVSLLEKDYVSPQCPELFEATSFVYLGNLDP